MSRSMERVITAPQAPGAYRDLLVCPAGHKLEVIKLVVFNSGGALTFSLPVVAIAAGGTPAAVEGTRAIPANTFNVNHDVATTVLYEGDKLQVFTQGGTTFRAMVTYIDVDYADG